MPHYPVFFARSKKEASRPGPGLILVSEISMFTGTKKKKIVGEIIKLEGAHHGFRIYLFKLEVIAVAFKTLKINAT